MIYAISVSFDQKEIIGAYIEEIILWCWKESKIQNRSFILSASADFNICLWEKKWSVLLKTFREDTQIFSIFISDDQYIISCSDDGTIKLWDKETGEAIRDYKGS